MPTTLTYTVIYDPKLCLFVGLFVLVRYSGYEPVIPATWEAEAGGALESRSFWPAWETWQDPTLKFFFKHESRLGTLWEEKGDSGKEDKRGQ
jgi:hypothetical protein